jgi:HSP20 family protein
MTQTLLSLNPVHEFRRMNEVLDRLFGSPVWSTNNQSWTLPLDVYEQNGTFTVKAAVPGIKAEDLDITVEDNILTIRGEHRHEEETEDMRVYRREYAYGTFTRSVRLPEDVAVDQIQAEFRDGFVYITMPKIVEPKPKAIKVPVKGQALPPTAKSEKKNSNGQS